MSKQFEMGVERSCTISTADFFESLSGHPYVMVRGIPDSVLRYSRGADIDVFCYDKAALGRAVLAFSNSYVSDGFQIKVRDWEWGDHTHIDFVRDGELELRFDLYGRFPPYQKTNIKSCLFYSIIENARVVEFSEGRRTVPIYVPSEVDNLLLRYIEYVEYYEERPDKIKHLDFILEAVEKLPAIRIGFLEKLHQYTDLPKCTHYVSPRTHDLSIVGKQPGAGSGIRRLAKAWMPSGMYRLLTRVYRRLR